MDRPDWIEAAEIAFAHIANAGQDKRLPHSMLGARKLFPALSSDYAAMTNAAIALFEATGNSNYIDRARQFIEQLDHWHQDENKTGYYLTASDSTDVPIRIRGDVDEAIPSATGQIIEALVRLSSVTGDLELQERAWKIAEHAAGRAAHQAYGQAGIVNACALALEPLKLVIVDRSSESKLVPVANRNPDPRRVDIVVRDRCGSESANIARRHPAANRQARRLAVHGAGLFAGGEGSRGAGRVIAAKIAFVILWRSKERSDAAQTIGSMP